MENEKPRLSSADSEKIRAGLEACISTLDKNHKLLTEAEQRLKKQLVQLRAEVEKIASSRSPFPGRDP